MSILKATRELATLGDSEWVVVQRKTDREIHAYGFAEKMGNIFGGWGWGFKSTNRSAVFSANLQQCCPEPASNHEVDAWHEAREMRKSLEKQPATEKESKWL